MPRRWGPAPRYGGSDPPCSHRGPGQWAGPRLYPTAHRAAVLHGETTGSTGQTAGSSRGNDEEAAPTAGASDSEHTDEEATGSTGLPWSGTDQAAHSGGGEPGGHRRRRSGDHTTDKETTGLRRGRHWAAPATATTGARRPPRGSKAQGQHRRPLPTPTHRAQTGRPI